MNENLDGKLDSINESINALAQNVGRLNTSIKKYSISSDKFSSKILYLNIVLTIATFIGAIATFFIFLNCN